MATMPFSYCHPPWWQTFGRELSQNDWRATMKNTLRASQVLFLSAAWQNQEDLRPKFAQAVWPETLGKNQVKTNAKAEEKTWKKVILVLISVWIVFLPVVFSVMFLPHIIPKSRRHPVTGQRWGLKRSGALRLAASTREPNESKTSTRKTSPGA